jgi:hypothetical protein
MDRIIPFPDSKNKCLCAIFYLSSYYRTNHTLRVLTFGDDTDYAMLVKLYGNNPNGERTYSPSTCMGAKKLLIDVRNGDIGAIGTKECLRHYIESERIKHYELVNALGEGDVNPLYQRWGLIGEKMNLSVCILDSIKPHNFIWHREGYRERVNI